MKNLRVFRWTAPQHPTPTAHLWSSVPVCSELRRRSSVRRKPRADTATQATAIRWPFSRTERASYSRKLSAAAGRRTGPARSARPRRPGSRRTTADVRPQRTPLPREEKIYPFLTPRLAFSVFVVAVKARTSVYLLGNSGPATDVTATCCGAPARRAATAFGSQMFRHASFGSVRKIVFAMRPLLL